MRTSSEGATVPGNDTLHVLVIEDDTSHQELIRIAFRRDPGPFRLTVVSDLRTAREVLSSDPPNLILADWSLPDGSGIEILPRDRSGMVTIPLVIMTSHGDEQLAVEIMKSGAIDYIVKSSTLFKDMPRFALRAYHEWKNIRDRIRAEDAERDSQKRLADIIGFLPDAVLAIDGTGTVIAWNSAMESLTGVSAAAMLGKGDHEYSIPFYGERRPILIDLVLAQDKEIEKRYDYLRRDGDRLTSETFIPGMFAGKGAYLWGTASPLYDAAGNRIGAIEVIRDITERKNAEDSMKRNEEILTLFIRHSPAALAMFDREMRYIAASNRWITDYHLETKEIIGKSHYEIFPEISPEIRAVHQRGLAGEVISSPGSCFIRADGTGQWISWEVRPWREPDNTIGGIIIFSEDITERKLAEEALAAREATLKTVLNATEDSIALLDRQGIILDINESGARRLGSTPGELGGRAVYDLLPPDLARTRKDHIDRVFAAGKPEVFDDQRNGRILHNEVYPVFSPSSRNVDHVAIFACDVTGQRQAERSLRESERKYRFLVDNVRDLIWQATPGLVFTYLSPAAETLTGWTATELTGKSLLSILTENSKTDVRDQLIHRMEEARSGEEVSATVFEIEVRRKDGGLRWFEVSSNPSYGPDGIFNGFQGIARDITQRKQAEQTREQYAARLDAAMAIGSLAWWEMDLPDGSVRFDDRKASMLGYSPGQFCHYTDFTVLLHPDDHEPAMQAMRDHLEGRQARYIAEYRIRTSTGEYRWFRDVGGTTKRHPDGTPATVTGIVIDITASRQADEALHRASRYNRSLIEANLDPLVTIGPDGTITDVNASTEQATGCPRDRLIGTDFSDYFTEPEKAREAYRRVFSEGEVRDYPLEIRRRDGNSIPVLYNASVFRDENGKVTGVFAAARDITDRKKADDALREYAKRLQEAQEMAHLGFWSWDIRTGDVTWSDEVFRIFRRDPAEFTPRMDTILALSPWPAEHERDRELIRRATESREPGAYEQRFLCPDGSDGWYYSTFQGRYDDEGNLVSIVGTMLDITDRKATETALRESEERYRTLVEELPDLVIVHRRGELLYINAAIIRLLGSTATELLHTNIMEYIAPESRQTVMTALETRERGGSIAPYVARLVLPGGSTRWVEIRGARIMYEGQPASFNVLTDITEKKWAEEALYESEKKFRTIADYTYDWEYWIGKDGNYVYVSPSSNRVCGYEPEDFYHNKDLVQEIVVPEDRQKVIEHQETLGAAPDTQVLEFRILTRDKRMVWIGHICQPIFSPEGEYLGRRGSNRDITQRKIAEDALRASETRFRSLIQNSSDIIRILDRDRKIVYESTSSERILGYPAGSLVGRNPQDYIHPDDRERVSEDFREVIKGTNNGVPTEFRILKADGSYLWVDAIGTNLLGVPGVDGIVITIRPIEQRKQMENELRENQIRLATAMDMASLVNWEFDVNTGMFTFNDRFYALYGTTAEQEGGYRMPAETYVREFVHPDDVAYATSVIGNVASITDPNYSAEVEHRIIRRDGEMRYVIVRFGVIMDKDGRVVRTRGANQDITNQKMMESEIRSLNRSLEQRVVQRTEELNKSLQEKELLLREIHHRVKNNLQIIISILRLQKRHITDPVTLTALMDGESRVRSMALVHEKLYRSKDLEHIDIGDYLKALTQYLFTTYAIEQRRIAFSVAIGDLSLDIQRAIPIGLILNELISNALKHAFPEGRKGEVRITGKKEEDRILIFIEDNGVGFPDGLDWKHTQSLGMHLVMTLIDQVRGTIELATGSKGSRFTISIPVTGGKRP
ncbi:PAS domain S-box protein [Methanoregula sp. PtaB.Bin085]|uniref:PAS domain S-box protein n=1 Tax=Methanoregula sp. PtaB.Bin085 TaxID=1811680 RepID=UPI0025FD683C|nr:PAS domain S-box protein [Methanoregula sp. PtaB.Bin085]